MRRQQLLRAWQAQTQVWTAPFLPPFPGIDGRIILLTGDALLHSRAPFYAGAVIAEEWTSVSMTDARDSVKNVEARKYATTTARNFVARTASCKTASPPLLPSPVPLLIVVVPVLCISLRCGGGSSAHPSCPYLLEFALQVRALPRQALMSGIELTKPEQNRT